MRIRLLHFDVYVLFLLGLCQIRSTLIGQVRISPCTRMFIFTAGFQNWVNQYQNVKPPWILLQWMIEDVTVTTGTLFMLLAAFLEH